MYSSQRTYCSSCLIVTAAVSLFVRFLAKGGSCVCVCVCVCVCGDEGVCVCVCVCKATLSKLRVCVWYRVRRQVQCNLTIINTLVIMRTKMDVDRVTLGRSISGELANMEGLT